MMTEEQAEIAHDKYMEIAAALKALVNRMTNGMTPAQDRYVRDLLNELIFWRD